MAGVKKTGIDELKTLLPSRPASATRCTACSGTGWFDAHGQLKDVHGRSFSFVCSTCAGLGWTDPSIDLNESSVEFVHEEAGS